MNSRFSLSIATLVVGLCFTPSIRAAEGEIPRATRPDPRTAITAARLKRYDLNRNGKLDADEIRAIGRDEMLKNDRNNDGRVDQFELKRPVVPTRMLPPMDELQRAMALEHAKQAVRTRVSESRKEK